MPIPAHDLFLFWFWLAVAFFWASVGWTVMRFVTPKALVTTYFKELHFSRAELFFAANYPGTLLRTGVFMAACLQERYRRGRKLYGYLDIVPGWYVRASKLFCFAALGHGVPMVSLLVGLALWPE